MAELGTRPDIRYRADQADRVPTKIAALASISMEASQDFKDFITLDPQELSRSVIDAETSYIINGTGPPDHYRA